jgi:hypothetical protein
VQSTRLPLISGFYKLLSVAVRNARKIKYFEVSLFFGAHGIFLYFLRLYECIKCIIKYVIMEYPVLKSTDGILYILCVYYIIYVLYIYSIYM